MRAAPAVLLLPLLTACSDYEFATEHWPTRADDSGLGDPDSGDPDGGASTGGGSGGGEDPDPDPPDEIIDDCTDGNVATLPSGGMVVLSWDPTSDSGTLATAVAGWYHVYDYTIAESGSSQTNETARFRIVNAGNPEGTPRFANCGEDWWVLDADNDGELPSGTRIYIGTFWLEAGQNEITMEHFCPTWRAGECASLHVPDDTSSTCDTNNANSVHFDGEGICIVPAR